MASIIEKYVRAENIILECQEMRKISYKDWLKRYLLFKALVELDLKEIDYASLAHSLLGVKVKCHDILEKDDCRIIKGALEVFAEEIEEMAEFRQIPYPEITFFRN